ncbi:response regulator [Chroococcidiopsis sp. FACHB-1243]|uniref:hybrid sensor histidine kinase/response regulator n=1 Tax=Chroococcidiopsis sp. [FACHB-1243] TaxID=2692781 RepID=UPI0017864FD3|nr:hybrid sensor histidine kinase/response regulator [Chroococcidiopsis sp. [FACHB-1243]]MBD2306224.1 response regulator [Chroococcidiopsis sp. [FACHB-1243]]
MLPEQQQRILGYFLEEASDHLNTIEQGLLNLQSTLADSEMVNEIFRAAHSIKGGAAMLGLNSIQRTAHRLEDFFKILKECPSIQIEQTLESLFLQVFDNLKALLEQLQNGSNLSDGEASRLMAEVEPVFAALEHQLSVLVGQAGGSMHPDELSMPAVTADAQAAIAACASAFEYSVPETLRELLQLFKQPETSQTRQELQACCTRLAEMGVEYGLFGWLTLCETAAGAIANTDNSYRTLAPVIIRELKQAQELILSHRADEITICEQLQSLSINTFLLDWEENNSNSFELNENQFTENSLVLGADIFTPPAIVDNEVKTAFSTEEQLDNLSDDDALSSLFTPKSDSNNQLWQETTDLLDVINDRSDDISLQDIESQASISSEETLALNNLFTEAQDISLSSIDEEPAFLSLFSAPTAGLDDVTSLEATNPTDNSENVNLNQLWIEETQSLPQLETSCSEAVVDSLVEAIVDTEIQLELGNEFAISDDLIAFVPQVESELTESEFDLSAIAYPASVTPIFTTDADNDVTESLTEWNSEIEPVELNCDLISEIDENLGLETDNIAPEIDEGWDDSNVGQLELGFSPMELSGKFSFETESSLEPLISITDDSNPDFMAGWDTSSEAPEMGFDSTLMELSEDLELTTNSSLELGKSLGLEVDSSLELVSDFDLATNSSLELGESLDLATNSSLELDESFGLAINSSLELDESFGLEAESSLELGESLGLETEADSQWSESSATSILEWDTDTEASELGFDSTADLFTSPTSEKITVTNIDSSFMLEESTDEMPTEDTASIAQWEASSETPELGFDSATIELDNTLNLELESDGDLLTNESLTTDDFSSAELMTGWDTSSEALELGVDSTIIELSDSISFGASNSELFAQSASMPVDDESTTPGMTFDVGEDEENITPSTTWNVGEDELGIDFDTHQIESEALPSFELEPSLELGDNFSLVTEASTEDAESLVQSDTDSETLEMGFDSATVELNDSFNLELEPSSDLLTDASLNLELEPNSDLLTDASLAATDDFSSPELMVGWDAGSEIETSCDDESSITSAAWGAGEAELSLAGDPTQTENEDLSSFELEPSLELGDNFDFMAELAENDAELFSTSTAAIIDENITELMSVVESIYQDTTGNEDLLGEAQADFLADSQLETDDDFPELNALLHEEESVTNAIATAEALLDLSSSPIVPAIETPTTTPSSDDDFGDLDLLLQETPKVAAATITTPSDGDFGDLEQLLQKTSAKTTNVVTPQPAPAAPQPAAASPSSRRPAFEQMMRVPVKQLDSIGNMVGELVVYRNSLEQDQERLRQFLDNLLHQVQQLGDVGTRMQELYERSLLEASLLNSRQGGKLISVPDGNSSSVEEQHATGVNFDALEMDRFTGFHTLAQEMIELIVRVREASSDIEFVTGETEQVARNFRQVTTHLQEGITRSRMVPFSQIAERLPRAVRDIALKYGKQAELQVEGNETLIDKGLLEQLYDPMTHLVNNAITHGIETPDERTAKGKAAAGKITIRAFHQGNQTVITVSDNGAGIDPEKVKAKAIANGLITPAEADSMDRLDVFNLIFQPGFSTKEQVDQFAGRGIGMDVVLTSLKQMRGTIHTDSTLGKGTTFTIRLPLTLSICKALCCVSDKARIAFPMDGVEQMIDIPVNDIVANAEGQTCIPWRDSLLPFRPLKELLGFTRQLGRGSIYGSSRDDNAVSIVILRSADTFFALQVDQVLGEQEIVIKQFEAPAPKPVGIAGATILGDGRIVPIADVLELIDLSVGRIQKDGRGTVWSPRHIPAPPIPAAPVKTEPLVLIIDDSITVRELLSMTFTNAGYRVEQARDGQEAWDKLRDGLPCDLVFCDIEMPRMDGLELLSRMQKEERLSQLPIAMLTSRGSDRHRQMALQLGASGYFTKPYLEEALLDGAQRMLKGEVLIAVSSASSM